VQTISDNLISVIDLANEHGKRKRTIFKILKRLRIEPRKFFGANNRGQVIAYITNDESRLVVEYLLSRKASTGSEGKNSDSSPESVLAEQGVFYWLLLEPNHDPGRFKVGCHKPAGAATSIALLSATYEGHTYMACKQVWEKTAIECVANGCERLHTEVFRTISLESVVAKCERFFELMPKLEAKKGAAKKSLESTSITYPTRSRSFIPKIWTRSWNHSLS